jgi:hypothetical protein
MTGGASRQEAQSCLVLSLPGRPAKRIKAANRAICSGALHLAIFDQPLTAEDRQAVYKHSFAAFPLSFVYVECTLASNIHKVICISSMLPYFISTA